MTKRQREILESIEQGKTSTTDPTEEFVSELQQLSGDGWIDLRLMRESMTGESRPYAAAHTLTPEGRKALAEERDKG